MSRSFIHFFTLELTDTANYLSFFYRVQGDIYILLLLLLPCRKQLLLYDVRASALSVCRQFKSQIVAFKLKTKLLETCNVCIK